MSEPATDTQIDQYEWEAKRSMWLMPERALALIARLRAEQATSTPPPSALVEGGEKPIDRTKFPYMWEGKRPSETIIHQVINKYMGEKDREYDNDQFKYYLNNWHGHAELNRRMRAAVEAVYAAPPSRNDTIRECMAAVLGPRYPSFCMGGLDQDEYGVILPGSPHDRGIYEAHSRLRALLTDEVTK